MAAAEGHQEHPLKIYWFMWIALFVLSAGSYSTDFLPHGAFRTFLILLFMMRSRRTCARLLTPKRKQDICCKANKKKGTK